MQGFQSPCISVPATEEVQGGISPSRRRIDTQMGFGALQTETMQSARAQPASQSPPQQRPPQCGRDTLLCTWQGWARWYNGHCPPLQRWWPPAPAPLSLPSCFGSTVHACPLQEGHAQLHCGGSGRRKSKPRPLLSKTPRGPPRPALGGPQVSPAAAPRPAPLQQEQAAGFPGKMVEEAEVRAAAQRASGPGAAGARAPPACSSVGVPNKTADTEISRADGDFSSKAVVKPGQLPL